MTRIVSVVLLALALVIGSGAPAQAHRRESHCGGVCGMHNAYRNSHGLRDLFWNKRLHRIAKRQAVRMAESNTLYHNPNLTTEVKYWDAVGENVGYGPDARTIMQAFIDSQEHRENILDHDYRQIGVGKVWLNGRLWISVVFRDPQRGYWRW